MLVASDDPGDVELVQRVKRGNRKAFGELVKRYQKRVYAICFRMTGYHDFADDLTQEAFIKAFEAIQSFDERYEFSGWICRIATNNAINQLKRQKFQLSGEEGQLVLERQPAMASESNPHVKMSQKEIDKRYQQALNNLPPEYRIVFLLRMEEDLSYTEIAQRVGISEGTVMSRLHRARQRLVEELKDLLE